jgi:hypothetical protein
MRQPRIRQWVVLVALGVVTFAPGARADSFDAAATTCDQQVYTQPFLPFGDVASYVLAPGGTFDGASGWSLANGAAVVSGNEPFALSGGEGESKSLLLPAGSSAASPPLCVGVLHPTIRFVVRSSSPVAVLRLEVLFKDVFGQLQSLEFARISATSAWFPTAPLLFLANATAPLASDGNTAVAFRFTALSGTWQMDDVYVDPYKDR